MPLNSMTRHMTSSAQLPMALPFVPCALQTWRGWHVATLQGAVHSDVLHVELPSPRGTAAFFVPLTDDRGLLLTAMSAPYQARYPAMLCWLLW